MSLVDNIKSLAEAVGRDIKALTNPRTSTETKLINQNITEAGWYTIATLSGRSVVSDANARAYAQFMITEASYGRHQVIDFTAGHSLDWAVL
ncbi:hypothetical protein [Psychrobacter sp. I-STPA10]|uniref:hypothetical protein n=1 Tax=Psychrobacter sp. I-STPA10 TaxID=2585769 RepID=UPI001E490CED|nr:hypothetical protein [Psychrobacter sp. I-STPA10]